MMMRVQRLFYLIVLSALMLPLSQLQAQGLPDFTGIVDSAAPAVVNITVTTFGERPDSTGNAQNELPPDQEIPEIFRRFFEMPGQPRGGQPDRVGGGSGFIIESDGYVVTNHHVIDGADQVLVRLSDRREYEAEVVGSDEQSDIALLKIDAQELPTLDWADNDDLRIGEWVLAIGSPFALEQTVTQGIVSATGRSNRNQQYVPFIQTDVAINRGNSGGPLLNMQGEVVGVNSWIFSNSGGYIGLSFSIPAQTASDAIDQLRTSGRVSRGLLGVLVGPINRDLAEAFGLERSVGALVSSVSEDSAAETAGIQVGDVIIEYNGVPIERWSELPPLVGATPPGEEVDVVVIRDGERRTLEATLIELSASPEELASASESEDSFSNRLGVVVESISPELREQLGSPEGGVLVTRVESDNAFRAGLRRGDVILQINNQSIENMRQFEDLVEDLDGDRAAALLIQRDGVRNFVAVRPDDTDS